MVVRGEPYGNHIRSKTVEVLRELFSRHGVPLVVVLDSLRHNSETKATSFLAVSNSTTYNHRSSYHQLSSS